MVTLKAARAPAVFLIGKSIPELNGERPDWRSWSWFDILIRLPRVHLQMLERDMKLGS